MQLNFTEREEVKLVSLTKFLCVHLNFLFDTLVPFFNLVLHLILVTEII